MARLVPSTPSLRWRATFAVPADKRLRTYLHHGPPLSAPLTPWSRHNPTRPPSPLELLNTPTPTAPFGNVVKRRRFPYLRISLPCEPNRKPKPHYAGCTLTVPFLPSPCQIGPPIKRKLATVQPSKCLVRLLCRDSNSTGYFTRAYRPRLA